MKLQDVVHLNIDLTFSPYLQKCKQDIETLGGQRTGSQWGNWDVLLKWAAWSKNGISPRNDAFERNLSNLFKGPKIAKIVQSSGVFFLKRLANTQIVNIASLVVVGAKIHLKQKIEGWGAKTIENLSKDLKSSFPNMQGFSFRNLKYIPYFVKEYPDFAIGQQLVAEIPFAFYPNKKVFKEVIL